MKINGKNYNNKFKNSKRTSNVSLFEKKGNRREIKKTEDKADVLNLKGCPNISNTVDQYNAP